MARQVLISKKGRGWVTAENASQADRDMATDYMGLARGSLNKKIFGLPPILVIGAAVLLGIFLLRRRSEE